MCESQAANETKEIKISVPGVTVEPLAPGHARIMPYLRRSDREEMAAASPLYPALQIGYSIATSRPGYAVLIHGEPVALFGASGGQDGTGVPWLLATDEIERHGLAFYRASKKFIAEMRGMYDYLENYVDERNVLSVRWLRWAGFEMDDAVPFGSGMFHRFWWKKGGDSSV